MNSRTFNCVFLVLFSRRGGWGGAETRGRKRSRLEGLNVGRKKKAAKAQKAHCEGQKCPRKGGDGEESHRWPPPLPSSTPWTHCGRRGVQPRMTDVPDHCLVRAASSRPPAPATKFHETASAWERRSTRLHVLFCVCRRQPARLTGCRPWEKL